MNRDKWSFPYTADKLLHAAKLKHNHHTKRLEWWENKKKQVLQTIKSEGITVDESQAAEFSKLSSYNRGTTVDIREDLKNDLNECVTKTKEHNNKIQGYDAWMQVLEAQGQSSFELNQEDWLYFFGK